MIGIHTKTPANSTIDVRPSNKRKPSKADTLPGSYGPQHSEPRRQISNPVQRSASHAKDHFGKHCPKNSSRPDHRPNPSAAKTPELDRPHVQQRNTSFQRRYTEMQLSLDAIPRMHNIYASFFTWITLVGYVVFPGTYTSMEDVSPDNDDGQSDAAANTTLDHVKNVPLLIVAALCCGVGVAGMAWLAIRWRRNYVWLLNRLFLPSVMNGLAGLISTLVMVYAAQNGAWSVTAKASAIVEGCCMAVFGILFVVYNNVMLKKVKKRPVQGVDAAQASETFLEKAERKLNAPALEPGSVV
ncbi:hypothetical protein JX265_002741 [Neoarthrinium moseri]|uniref:Uncharacterized protein n=1 Tax=Neoarthrinium moseri TaxID=1658444 RepID=A0A9P9WSR7_9PEZI|nr:hypothetical protein JX265_002741 [Neoarthrinium moseri]